MKMGSSDEAKFPAPLREAIHDLNSGPFLRFLETVTGIRGLLPDPHLAGGGIHLSRQGDHLGIHADFNWHAGLSAHRRLNLLVYLSPRWEAGYGGELELWDTTGTRRERVVAPLFNAPCCSPRARTPSTAIPSPGPRRKACIASRSPCTTTPPSAPPRNSAPPTELCTKATTRKTLQIQNPGQADERMETDPDTPHSGQAQDLFAEVYARLKAMAARQLARPSAGATLETTGLVHELYLRMCSGRDLAFAHEAQFFSYAARAMRHLLADRARDRLRQRAGGEWIRVTLTGCDEQLAIDSAEQALAMDAALERLERADARAAQVLQLHYFAGLTVEQIATTLDLSSSTVDRDCRFARAFLKAEIVP